MRSKKFPVLALVCAVILLVSLALSAVACGSDAPASDLSTADLLPPLVSVFTALPVLVDLLR